MILVYQPSLIISQNQRYVPFVSHTSKIRNFVSGREINFDRLLDYTIRFKSQAVIKRLGYLIETLEMDTPILGKLSLKKTASYVTLDTELPRAGKFIKRWSILQNIETATLKSALFT